MEKEKQIDKQASIAFAEVQQIITKWLTQIHLPFDWSQEVRDNAFYKHLCDSCSPTDALDTWKVFKEDLEALNPFKYQEKGFSEQEVKIMFHNFLKKTIQSPICEVAEYQGRLGLTYGESLKLKRVKENDLTFFVDAVVQMWLGETAYVPLLFIEFKPTLNQATLSIGEEEVIKYAYTMTQECSLDVLYGLLVGINSYVIYKYENGHFWKTEIEDFELPDNMSETEPMTASFYQFFKLIVRLLWASFEKNLKGKNVNISRGT